MASRAQPSINEALRDAGIAHAVQIERLKNAEQVAVIAYIEDELLPDLIAKLEARMVDIDQRGVDIGPETTKRLQRLIVALQGSVDAWTSRLAEELIGRMGTFARFEGEWAVSSLADRIELLPVLAETAIPAVAQLQQLAAARPIDGALPATILERLGAASKSALERQVRLGIAAGETTPQIARRVRGVTDLARGSAIAVTRTIVGHAAAVGRDAAYEANADLLQGVQWVATLDTRTCPTCAPLDGKVFKVGEGPRPTLHVQCRCSTAPVLKSWSQLGIKARELDRSTRASADGQVSDKITFGDWLKRRSAAEQDDVLGVTRAKLFRSGKLKIGDFVSRSNELLTLDQLRARYADAFAKAGL